MKSFISALAILSSGSALAWGPTGHRAVGEIATRFLDTKALVEIHKILDGQSLARVSTWPDEIKSEPETYSHTYNWHYTTWPTEVHDHSEHTETTSTGFLLKSINEQMAVLKDVNQPKDKKAFAIKFLVHLVGDLHQPLHVGNGTDQGGNFCKVTFHGRQFNLHALWDEGMIDFTNLSYTELAKFASEGKTVDEVRRIKAGTVVEWTQESKNLVPQLYPAEVVATQEPMSIKTYCKKEVLPEEMPKLAYEYSYKWMPVIEKRIYEAGVRLGVLLNQAFK